MKILIKNGIVITSAASENQDILIDGSQIVEVEDTIAPEGVDQVVDAKGLYVMPGGIDVHTHLALPMFDTISSDDHYTGHKAAAFGGTTTVLDFIAHDDHDLLPNIERWHQKAAGLAALDYSFHMNLTHFDRAILEQLPLLVKEGITSVKMFTAYNDRLRLNDAEIFQVMRASAPLGLLPMLHAENGDVIELLVQEALAAGHVEPIWHARTRPAWGAVEAAFRGVSLAAQAGAPLYLVHMNTAGETDVLRYAKQEGLPVFGETCPPYLFFTEEDLQRPDGAKWICSPPMRTRKDNEAIWQALTDGVIDTIGTDHCPFFYDGTQPIIYEGEPVKIAGKELGAEDFTKIPNGLPGVGDRLPVLWTEGVGKGRLTAQQFVAMTSTMPARIFGMYPRKGTIQPGSDADLVLWDPEKTVEYGVKVAHHRTDYNLFEGWQLTGYPVKVYSRGELIVDGERWYGKPGRGEFLHRQPFSLTDVTG
jgi:dihydropyrimidinase